MGVCGCVWVCVCVWVCACVCIQYGIVLVVLVVVTCLALASTVRNYAMVMLSYIDSHLQPAAIAVRFALNPTCVTPCDHQMVPFAVPPSNATFVPVANVRL